MSFDNSRITFNPWNDYCGVVMEQGRPQTDADWNEWLKELSRRTQAGTLDLIGHAAYPATTPYAFQIAASTTGGTNAINIGVGRMYVDGILVENHGNPATVVWDSALEEMSNCPQPPPSAPQPLGPTNSIAFTAQPYNPGATVPTGSGSYLAYLNVWRRPVTYIEDASLVDVAIGVDTTGRVQTAWQVALLPLPSATVAGSVTSGTFTAGEEVVQSNTGATATLIGTVTGGGPMTITALTGTPDATDTWVGQTSGAVFTPTALPVASYSTVTGSVTSGTFVANEQVKQSTSGATANLVGTVVGAGPMYIGGLSGTPDATDTWVGQTSNAVFTPSAVPVISSWSCSTADSAIPWPTSSGNLTLGHAKTTQSGPCCLTTGSGYTGVENQLYRVEIHEPGTAGGAQATFKWSRENASVQTGVTGIDKGSNSLNQPASVLTVLSLGRDQVLGFTAGNWIEITNQTYDDNCLPGELYKIDSVDVATSTITLTTLLSTNFPASSLQSNTYTRIIRWDQSGKIYKSDNTVYIDLDSTGSSGQLIGTTGIPVPTDGSALILEGQITVQLGLNPTNGVFQPMDYWNFAARTADGSVETLTNAPPRGIHHHYTKLSIVTFGTTAGATDCRKPWGPSGTDECGCCTYTVGDGVESVGKYSSIQQAINALGPSGGEICLLPGSFYENVVLSQLKNVVIKGCGWQTHWYSAALSPGGGAAGGSGASGGAAGGGASSGSTASSGSPAGGGTSGGSASSGSAASGGSSTGSGGTSGSSVSSGGTPSGGSSTSSGGTASGGGSASGSGTASAGAFPAVITALGCRNVELRSFSVGAATGEVGILLDSALPQQQHAAEYAYKARGIPDRDIIIDDLFITASTLPAILAHGVNRLKILNNRIEMQDVASLYAAVYMSGEEIFFRHNHVGIKATPSTTTSTVDTQTQAQNAATGQSTISESGPATSFAGTASITPGGIQIAGPSVNVFVVENEITGGARNGITLGNYIILDTNGGDTGTITGVITEPDGPCCTGGTVTIPGSTSGSNPSGIAAGGLIRNLHIERNRIHDTGLSGIGVVGFFELNKNAEVISLENVSIIENVLARTLRRRVNVSVFASVTSIGAINLADVENLMIRDNIITDYGFTPAAPVSGIAILHGQMVEISRNQIKETRDWSERFTDQTGAAPDYDRAGIYLLLVTPPDLNDTQATSVWSQQLADNNIDWTTQSALGVQPADPVYAPGLPALRIQENVVRVAYGYALAAMGYGPFEISDNHFATGGTIRARGQSSTSLAGAPTNDTGASLVNSSSSESTTGAPIALTVLIANLGLAVEDENPGYGYQEMYSNAASANLDDARGLANSTNGSVLFTNNVCQIEAWASGAKGFSSVMILSLDHLLFANNMLWLDGPTLTAWTDALLLAASLQCCSNRLQEAPLYPVIFSAMSVGVANITSQNLSTYCLFTDAAPGYLIDAQNLVLNTTLCASRALKTSSTATSKKQGTP